MQSSSQLRTMQSSSQLRVRPLSRRAVSSSSSFPALHMQPEGGGGDAMSMMSSMFGSRWSEADLRSVLSKCGGNAGRAIEAVLAHDAASDGSLPVPVPPRPDLCGSSGSDDTIAAGGLDCAPPPLARSRTVADSARIVEVCETRVQQLRRQLREHDAAAAASREPEAPQPLPSSPMPFWAEADEASGGSDSFERDNDVKRSYKEKYYEEEEEYSYEMDDYEEDDYADYEKERILKEESKARAASPPKQVQRAVSTYGGLSVCSSLSSGTRCEQRPPQESPRAQGLPSVGAGSGSSGHTGDQHEHDGDASNGGARDKEERPQRPLAVPTDAHSLLYPELSGLGHGHDASLKASRPQPQPQARLAPAEAAALPVGVGAETRTMPISAMSAEEKDRLLHSLLFDSIGGGRDHPTSHPIDGAGPGSRNASSPPRMERDPLAFDASALDEMLRRSLSDSRDKSLVATSALYDSTDKCRDPTAGISPSGHDSYLDESLRLSTAKSCGSSSGSSIPKDAQDQLPPDDSDLAKALEISKNVKQGDQLPPDDWDLAKALDISMTMKQGDQLPPDDSDLAKALEISKNVKHEDHLQGDDDLERALELSRMAGREGSPQELDDDLTRVLELSRKSSEMLSHTRRVSQEVSDDDLARALDLSRKADQQAHPEDHDDELVRALDLSRRSEPQAPSEDDDDDDDDELVRALDLSKRSERQDHSEDTENDDLAKALVLSRKESELSAHTDTADEELARALRLSLVNTSHPGSYSGTLSCSRQQSGGEGNHAASRSILPVRRPWPSGFEKQRQCSTGSVRSIDDGQRIGTVVHGAGVDAVNGVYHMTGRCSGTGMYTKQGIWEARPVNFTLYRCLLANNDLRWFISIVPQDVKPGTDEDRDFYVARGTGERGEIPPASGWAALTPFGREPAPLCSLDVAASAPTSSERNSSLVASGEVFIVESAGREEVVGTYEWTGTQCGAGIYTKSSKRNGMSVNLTVFRSSYGEGRSLWYLSAVPEGCNPGSNGDTDLYLADSTSASCGTEEHERPPQHGWKSIPGFGLDPPPFCWLESVAEQVESESESIPPPPPLNDLTSVVSMRSTTTQWLQVTDEYGKTKPRKVAMCIICRARPVTHVLIPCGHPCLCENCAAEDKIASLHGRCPIARCKFHSSLRFFGTLVEDHCSTVPKHSPA